MKQGHYFNREICYIVIAFLLNLKVNFKAIKDRQSK